MKIREVNRIEKVVLTEEERNAFQMVEDILYDFQRSYSEDSTLTSQLTGECIEVYELRRVRGVLGFFIPTEDDNQIYSVN